MVHVHGDSLVGEIVVRVLIWVIFIYMELCTPFVRFIQPEELWLYKYPRSKQYVSPRLLWMIVILIPMTLMTLDYLRSKNRSQYKNGILCFTLLLGLNGFITMFIKLIVGRPRPDFYYRCFPDGIGNDELDCTGDKMTVLEGRKSFPSGHASFAFCGMVYTALFLNGRLKPFRQNGAMAWRLVCCILPLLVATGISISRTCDYHHHWQDVTVGGLLGSVLAYVCYIQYFPSTIISPTPSSAHCNEVD